MQEEGRRKKTGEMRGGGGVSAFHVDGMELFRFSPPLSSSFASILWAHTDDGQTFSILMF